MVTKILPFADLSWSEKAVPKSEQFDDYYYSSDSGLEESDYVFLKPNQLAQRFLALGSEDVFCIAETGFGTGLNFLNTCSLWLNVAPEKAQLHFISVEKFPLMPEALEKAHQAFPQLAEVSAALRASYPQRLPGWHDVYLWQKRVRLTLWFGDALKGISDYETKVDAWFLDGFTPTRNPQMWQPALYTQMARLSHSDTTFATFTAAGAVRRGLAQAGFKVIKQPGFGPKREMCFGRLVRERTFSSKAPWFERPEKIHSSDRTAIVIGAGMAGATAAYQLAQQGWKVSVVESASNVATQASGNLAGAIHPLVTADWNLRSQFYLLGLQATLRWLTPWLQAGKVQGELCGLMQLAINDTVETRMHQSLQRVNLPENFAAWCDASTASNQIGSETLYGGLFFPQGGWVRPSSIVSACLSHPNIMLHLDAEVLAIEQVCHDRGDKGLKNYQAWSVQTLQKEFKADTVVVATGALSESINQKLCLPIRPVKGQVSHFAAQQSALKTVVTHQGYSVSFPETIDGIVALSGATFEAPDMRSELTEESHQHNVKVAQAALPGWVLQKNAVSGKVGFRPTTPDHLPLIGAVADGAFMHQSYFSQSPSHAVFRYPVQQYQRGLYVSNGHGARGLMSVFLAAEQLGAMMDGQPSKLPLSLLHAVHPARLQIRDWRHRK